jgi:sugar phosphate isomerase/epimerase
MIARYFEWNKPMAKARNRKPEIRKKSEGRSPKWASSAARSRSSDLQSLEPPLKGRPARISDSGFYHAHPFDFAKIDGRFAWEILFSHTQPEVNMQMDVGNCLAGNGDPIAMLKEFPGRTQTIHIKEREDKTFESDFYKEIFRLCETTSATKWYIVEMGGPEGNGFEVPRQALDKLRRLGK